MHARQAVPAELSRLAALQSLVVTREQAIGHGLSPSATTRLVREGIWRRLASGVFLTAAIEPGWESMAWAGVLIGGDRARLAGAAAGHRYRLVADPPAQITVLLPADGPCPRAQPPWWFSRERPRVRDARSWGAPPCTLIEDTVLDLVAAECDENRVTTLVTAAIGGRHTTTERLARAVRRRRRLRHRALLEHLVADTADGANSFLEIRYLHDVERAHGLPSGRRQVRSGKGICDVFYEAYGLIVELDGKAGHSGTDAFRDMARDNSATGRGLATLRFGYPDVIGRGCLVARQVAHNLSIRGWDGLFRSCRHCLASATAVS